VPFAGAGGRGILIACSREAKQAGIKNIMNAAEAREICPDLVLVPQNPDHYRRAHNALLAEISLVIPIDAVKSIDELTCRVQGDDRRDPHPLALRLKARLRDHIGPWITCSVGFAANRHLAKMACKAGKWHDGRYGNGLTIWPPAEMPAHLLPIKLEDIPGVGRRMARRLTASGIASMADLLSTEPKQMRALWRSVTGERLWYALHGYDIQTPPSGRGMYGHGRVLPPGYRTVAQAREASRLLIVKAARRMRRERCNASRLWLSVDTYDGGTFVEAPLRSVSDDISILHTLEDAWRDAGPRLGKRATVARVSVTLLDLTPMANRQTDLLEIGDEKIRDREAVTSAIDALNAKYGRTLVSVGPWLPPPGGYAGGKISYTRIPAAEDFW
jgi:DNA polymerase-4